MVREFVMPQLGLSMERGRIVRWLKQSGETVRAGEVLLEVESDKATIEVEAVDSGRLQIVHGVEQGEVEVGAVIAYLVGEGEAPVSSGQSPIAADQHSVAEARARQGEGAISQARTPALDGPDLRAHRLPSSPAARCRAAELSLDWREATGTGRSGRIKERDVLALAQRSIASVPAATAAATTPQLTRVARRMADEFGLELGMLTRLFPGKARVEREDVEQAVRQLLYNRSAEAMPPALPATPAATRPGGRPEKVILRREPLGSLRRRIAERMAQSAHTAAPVTLTAEVDATKLVRLRETLKAASAPLVPTYNAVFTKIIAATLADHPALNASLSGDEIVFWQSINVGCAVDTERGLVVPVVRDVQAKTLAELTREMESLLKRAAEGKAVPDDLQGGTFTLTNLGAFGIDAFTPIINPPETAVLGVGRLAKKMVVVGEQPEMRTLCVLSLTFDHRLVDGGPAARFLQRFRQLVEQPYLWLI